MSVCEECHTETPIDLLDGKPRQTLLLWLIRLFRGQAYVLRYASDHGYDFDRLECRQCYGPGYEVRP